MDSSKDIKDIQYRKDNNQKEVKNSNNNSFLNFLNKYGRYIAAGVFLVFLILVLFFFMGQKESKEEDLPVETGVEAFQENAYPEVNALIQNYYNAYAAGDLGTLMTLASPVTEKEQGYIALFSQYVEYYQNMVYYTKTGLDSNSYIVNVYIEIKFYGVDTVAPGLDFFYVRTNENGSLYIDNLYSQYNMRNKELAVDTTIQNRINEYENEEDVALLLQQVRQQYDAALAADENLSNIVNVVIPQAISEWVAALSGESTDLSMETDPNQQGESVETTDPGEAQPQPEMEGEAQPQPEPEGEVQPEEPQPPATETVKATSRVNIRAGADTATERIGIVESGTTLTRVGVEGEWSIIEYNGGVGYIKSEFLTTDLSFEPQEGTPAEGGLAEGTVITLQDTINIRSSMSETSEKVGVGYPGDTVTVIMSYAEGWTKVTWNGQTGYIKSDLLQ